MVISMEVSSITNGRHKSFHDAQCCWHLLDPHPGNILLVYDDRGNPQLGLIDYGQVKSLSKKQRHLLCKLVIALADDDRDAIIELVKEAG
jgi:hypothetical protein